MFNFLFSLYETIKQDIGKNTFLVQKNYILSKFYYLKMCFTIFSNGGGHLIDFAHNSDSGGKCVIALSPAPWRIGTLKYLEIEIIFMMGKHYVLQPMPSQRLAELWRYCYFLGYYRPSLKVLALFLFLSEDFFVSSESLVIWL